MTKHHKESICKYVGCDRKVRKGKVNKDGVQLYRSLCRRCESELEPKRSPRRIGDQSLYLYGLRKKKHCEKCEFIAEDSCQLDIDHLDGDHENNARENLQTLCANCHRLKTKLAKEGVYRPTK